MNSMTWLMIALGVVVGAALGALLHWAWMRRHATQKLRLPVRWLMSARGLVTSEEQEVWQWLRQAFPDHVVMVKVPVTRFTIPSTNNRSEKKDQHLHDLLHGVYCTFAVSSLNGKVVGCVDLPGKRGLSKAQRDMKESLLQECGIGYTTVRTSSLPSRLAMRAAFLGEVPPLVEPEAEETRGGDSSFHAALNEFTKEKVRAAKESALQEIKDQQAESDARKKNRKIGFNPDGTGAFAPPGKTDRFALQWEDSFTMPSESRPARLS